MEEYLRNPELSPVELAKHLKSLKPLTSTEQDFRDLISRVVPEHRQERISQIVKGLSQEDEFAIICKLMDTCVSLARFDQTPIITNREIAPDFIASFSPGCTINNKTKNDININYNCFVEVKSTEKDIYKISRNDLKKRIRFAERYSLPLVFAVRFTSFINNGFWILKDAKKLSETKRIEVGDFLHNLNHVLFDDYGICTHPNLYVANYYNSEIKDGAPLHKDYGGLENTSLIIPDEKENKWIQIEKNDLLLVKAFMNMFTFEDVEVKHKNNVTCVISQIGFQNAIMSDLMFRINRLATNEDGTRVFDATRVISLLDSKKNNIPIITREMIEYVIYKLNSNHQVLFQLALGKPGKQEEVLLSLNNRKV